MLRSAGDYRFVARLEEELAPATVAAFRRLLPLESRIIHARWSGESCWIPFGRPRRRLRPRERDVLPGAGAAALLSGRRQRDGDPVSVRADARSRARPGCWPGNHFATIVEGVDRLGELGRKVLWEGAQPLRATES